MPTMHRRRGWVRPVALSVNAFVAVTAVGGGVALAVGAEGSRFPVEWLDRTPWSSYLVPGLVLALGVGGSAVLALAAVALRMRLDGAATALAALVLAGQIAGELALLAQPDAPTSAELFYLGLAGCMLGCGALLHRAHRRPLTGGPRSGVAT